MIGYAPFLGQVRLVRMGQERPFRGPGPVYVATQFIARHDELRTLSEQVQDPEKKAALLNLLDSIGESYSAVRAYDAGYLPEYPYDDVKALDDNNAAVQSMLTAATVTSGLAIPEDIIAKLQNFKERLDQARVSDAKYFQEMIKNKRRSMEEIPATAKKFHREQADIYKEYLNDIQNTLLFYRREIDRLIDALPADKRPTARDFVKERPLPEDLRLYPMSPVRLQGSFLGQTDNVICEGTPEGGKHCSDGTYFAPGSSVPVSVPGKFPWIPAGIGAVVIGGVLYALLS